ncbi:MAG: hypothetical protein R3C05_18140 [Pirellulaceae bacterium]
MLFPLWFLKSLIFAALTLCVLGVCALLFFLFVDTKQKRIW